MGKRVTVWELWALALLGIWLKFFAGKSGTPIRSATHPTKKPVLGGSLVPDIIHGMGVVAQALGALLVIGAIGGLLWMGLRLWMRRRRLDTMVAEEIILGPDDNAKPEEMVGTLDAIHTTLLTRYGGSSIGQVSWTFEVIREENGQIHFVMAAPHRWLSAIEDVWRGAYTNLRFQPWGDVDRSWAVAQQIVLARSWMFPTRIDTTYTHSTVETLVQAMDRAEGAVRLQWLLTPLPVGPLTAKLRGSLHAREYFARAQQQVDPAHPGMGMADRQDAMQASSVLGRSAYRAEVRLAADTWDAMQRVFGALAGSNAENQWKAQTIVLFRRWWMRWLNRRVPSLGGLGFGSLIIFSKPLATVIHVPSARLRVQSLTRKLVRRGPAPPAIPRTPALAFMRDENGPVGIPEADRKFNTLFIGSQGGGKSTGMLQQVRVDGSWRDSHGRPKAMVLLDIGKDTGKRALGMIPPDREVIWFDPSDPDCPWTLNPLAAGAHANALANDVLEALTQVFGEEAIRARSREFLGNAILAVKDVHGDQADFRMVYKMLTDHLFRQDVIDRVTEPHQQEYWQGTFTQTVANNRRFIEEGLAAPRNKLDEVLRAPSVRDALTQGDGRQQLDLRDIVTGRKVLIANLDKSRLGKSGARLLGVFLITMLWHALETQSILPEAERVPTALIIDEAQNFISEGFLDILAEGRAYGAQTTLAVRFLGEIQSERAIMGIRTLVQNLVIYQFELRDEAEDFMKRFMRTYSNMISPSDEAQDNINFGADDFMRLPKHHVVCRWMVEGSPQQAFLAETIPWESYYREETKAWHLSQQPTRSIHEVPTEEWEDPEPESLDRPPRETSDAPVAAPQLPEVPAGDVPDAPPPWLSWLDPQADPATWWDTATGAGQEPLWRRMQQEEGVPVIWALEGLDGLADDFLPLVRRRAVEVATPLAGRGGVVAWINATTLGCWLAPGTVIEEAQWIAAAAARNLVWRRVVEAKQEGHSQPEVTTSVSPEPERLPIVKDAPEISGKKLNSTVWRALERQSGLTEYQIREWQNALKATEDEVSEVVRWAVTARIPPKTAAQGIRKMLSEYVYNRLALAIGNQVHAPSKSVLDLLAKSSQTVVYWHRWIRQHPEIVSLDMLQKNIQAQQSKKENV